MSALFIVERLEGLRCAPPGTARSRALVVWRAALQCLRDCRPADPPDPLEPGLRELVAFCLDALFAGCRAGAPPDCGEWLPELRPRVGALLAGFDPFELRRLRLNFSQTVKPEIRCASLPARTERLWARLRLMHSAAFGRDPGERAPPAAVCTPLALTTLTCECTVPGLVLDAAEFVRNHAPDGDVRAIKTRIAVGRPPAEDPAEGPAEAPAEDPALILFAIAPGAAVPEGWTRRGFPSSITMRLRRPGGRDMTAKVFTSDGKIQITGILTNDPAAIAPPFEVVRGFFARKLGRALPPLADFRVHMCNARWDVAPFRREGLLQPVRVRYQSIIRAIEELRNRQARGARVFDDLPFEGRPPVLDNCILVQNKQRQLKVQFYIPDKDRFLPVVLWPSGKVNIQGAPSQAVCEYVYAVMLRVFATPELIL